MAETDEHQIYAKRYRIEKKLGAGNFGTAYLVTDLKMKTEQKVLKVVRLGEMDPEESVDSVREAQLLSKLDNEHIVKFHESFLENDCLCIVTEFCDGGDLDQRLKELKKQNKTLEEDQVVEWLIQILLAVQYMHKSRVLHRDLKARNIFLKNNQIKIGDFGISRVLIGTVDVATTFTGTPYYMSPEVMKHDGYEAKSDIWSVGCLLYEMCTFQHAFDGKGLMNVIYKVVEGKAPPLPKTYSKSLDNLLKKMFIKDPKERPSANDILNMDFIKEHRQRTKLMNPLETTIAGKNRALEISDEFQKPINYRQLRDENVRIRHKNYPVYENDDEEENSKATNVIEQEEEEEQTLKPSNSISASRDAILARKMQQADARGHLFNQAIRANAAESKQHGRNPEQHKSKNNSNVVSTNYDDRPITPMRTSYNRIAGQYANDDETSLNNNDQSPTRQQRVMSSSQRSTMNSLSRTIDARFAAKPKSDVKPMSPSQTIGSLGQKQKTFIDDNAGTLRDNPMKDAYGPMAKEKKIDDLRMKAIRGLGEQDFQRVYDYYVQQQTALKTNTDLDEAKISQGAKAMVKNPSVLFLVEQLVFLEMH